VFFIIFFQVTVNLKKLRTRAIGSGANSAAPQLCWLCWF